MSIVGDSQGDKRGPCNCHGRVIWSGSNRDIMKVNMYIHIYIHIDMI